MNDNQLILGGVIILFLGLAAGVALAQINLPATSAQKVHWMNEGYNRCESFYGITPDDKYWIQNYINNREETYKKYGLWTLYTFDIYINTTVSDYSYHINDSQNYSTFYYDTAGNLVNYGS